MNEHKDTLPATTQLEENNNLLIQMEKMYRHQWIAIGIAGIMFFWGAVSWLVLYSYCSQY